MKDRLRLNLGEDRLERGQIDDVELPQCGGGVHPSPVPGGEVIDHRHLVAALEQRVDHVRADEPGSAGHDRARAHRRESIRRRAQPTS